MKLRKASQDQVLELEAPPAAAEGAMEEDNGESGLLLRQMSV